LLDLINEILDTARIESRQISLSPEALPVIPLLTEVVNVMRPLAAQRAVKITLDLPAVSPLHILADPQRLKQVLLNLVANVVKYNHEGGAIQIGCARTAPDQLRIWVRDTGRVFRRYRFCTCSRRSSTCAPRQAAWKAPAWGWPSVSA
jgi:signal transduction histidine kinase